MSFKLIQMGSTHPSYEFDIPWKVLAKPFRQPLIHRETCSIYCELEEFAGRFCNAERFAQVKFFTGFDTLSVTYEGNFLEREIGIDGKLTHNSEYMQRIRSEARRRGFECLSGIEETLGQLEKHLGKGSIIDVSQSSKVLYARKLCFSSVALYGGTPV